VLATGRLQREITAMGAVLPTGTVTFLCTDVEGSTRLLEELGAEAYAQALDAHRRLVRDSCELNGGTEVDTQGDSFLIAFPTALGALEAGQAITDGLASTPIRVRIGVHTGTPLVTEEGYVGVDVHRAARIAAASHGGQVLVSATTAALVDLELRDVGVHRLKDLTAAERLFQLGQADFPPLRTLDATALPIAASALIGREEEVSALVSLLRDSHRLVTVTGPGGIGKTRLALEVAAELLDAYADGVYWVPLAGVTDAELVLPAMRQTLGAHDELARHVRERELLVVLDTLEHLVDAASDLADLLGGASRLRLLVTSRVPLHLSAEFEYPVDPLPATNAATLFVERARAVGQELELDETVGEICARLDNLPLALELAAARTKLLDPASLLARLETRLPLLAGGPRDVPERQRTLRAAIQWSYDLLDGEARALFRRLAVFAGSFSLEAAEEVGEADLDALSRLVDASLLKSVGDGRLLMLETIREYGLERLAEAGEAPRTRDRHAVHFARLADRRWLDLVRGDDLEWSLSTIQLDLRNLHSAVEWSLERGRPEEVLEIGSGIFPFWCAFGYIPQGRRWLERALKRPSGLPTRRAHALLAVGDLAFMAGDLEAAKCANDESLAIFRDLDEPLGVAVNLTELADIALLQGDRDAARRLAEESAAIRRERLGSFHLGRALYSLAEISVAEGNYGRARGLLDEAIEYWSVEAPESNHQVNCHESLGEVLRLQGEFPGAVEAFATSIRIGQRRGEPPSPDALEEIAAVWATLGQHERAARTAGAAHRIREQLGHIPHHPNRPLPERVEPAWSEGRAMSAEEAVEYALNEPAPA
jgi:predicted ATPase/class 3 adenylate cyclase